MRNIPVIRSSMPPYEEYTREIQDLWDSRWLSNHGSKVIELEKRTGELLGSSCMLSTVNGHQALEAALRGLDLTGEVITTPYTFVSTTAAIVRCGLTPVFCDIREEDFTMDPACIESLITDKTSAILPVHVYGNLCRDEEIMKIARQYGLKVIYDAAHAFGVEEIDRKAGSMGDMSVFSLHATKAFHSIEGGLIAFHDPSLEDRLWEEQNFGISSPDQVGRVAPNAKMNEFQAAMGLCNLKYFDIYVSKRKEVSLRYHQKLGAVKGIRLNKIPEDVKSNYAYFPIFVDEEMTGISRDELQEKLAEKGIGTRKYFWPLTSAFDCFRSYALQKTPIAEKLSAQVLTIPMYSDLTMDDVDYVCDSIIEIIEGE